MTTSSVPTLASVKTFCTRRPASTPRVLSAVSSRITPTATSCSGLTARTASPTSGSGSRPSETSGADVSAGQSCPA